MSENLEKYEKLIKLLNQTCVYILKKHSVFIELTNPNPIVILTEPIKELYNLATLLKSTEYKLKKQKRIKQERIKQEIANQETAKLKKDQEYEKAFELEKKIRGQIPCSFCGKPIKQHPNTNSPVKLVNIAHNPKIIYFCKKKCKLNWIFQNAKE